MARIGRLLLLLAAVIPACKKDRPASPPKATAADTAAVACPSNDALLRVLGAAGRDVRTDCLTFPVGSYWMASALRMADQETPAPRLHLISGGASFKPLVFDVAPAPIDEITALIKSSDSASVRIRRAGQDGRLVRVGVVGRRGPEGRVESDEVAVLLQLVAHKPPNLVWSGAGDKVTVTSEGCAVERLVDFQLLFRTRLEMFTSQRARAVAGSKAACEGGPGMQENIPFRPVPLSRGNRQDAKE
jgi:hypothetical protein